MTWPRYIENRTIVRRVIMRLNCIYFGFSRNRHCTIYRTNIKVLISCAVTVFLFLAYADCRFSFKCVGSNFMLLSFHYARSDGGHCFLIGEWSVCLHAFLAAIGMPLSTYYTIQRRYRSEYVKNKETTFDT